MTWVKLDDAFFDNPKARKAGKDGRALAIASWCHCAQLLTDGFIGDEYVDVLCAKAGVPKATVKKLVNVGMWDRVEGGYEAHDYLVYNPDKQQVEREREQAKERMQSWRNKRRKLRRNERPNEQGERTPEPTPEVRDTPVSRNPLGTTPPPSLVGDVRDSGGEAEIIDEALDVLVERELEAKIAAGDGPRNQAAWRNWRVGEMRSEATFTALCRTAADHTEITDAEVLLKIHAQGQADERRRRQTFKRAAALAESELNEDEILDQFDDEERAEAIAGMASIRGAA